jgi:RHS repeat-associated protein
VPPGAARTIDLPLARRSQPHAVAFSLASASSGTLAVESLRAGKPDHGFQATMALAGLAPGWHQMALPPDAPPVDGLRVRVEAGGEDGAALAELRVAASPLPRDAGEARLTVSYPLHGECVDHTAYVRGFVEPVPHRSGAPVLFVDGRQAKAALALDGSFAASVREPGGKKPGARWDTRIEARYPDGETLAQTVAIDACIDGDARLALARRAGPRGLIEDVGAPFGQIVRAGKAATVAFAGATLEIPPGALEHDVRITVRPLTDRQVRPLDPLMDNVTPDKRGYRFGPHGLKFRKPVKLSLPYASRLLPAGTSSEDVLAFFYDEDGERWRPIERAANARDGALTSLTEHFTDFINATLAMPDHPMAASFDPNTIKGMKQGDATAGVDLVDAPAPSATGVAHLTYPIELPPGRQGVQPVVQIAYNSEGANGWLGTGWDLVLPAITVDTRFGVPRYGSGSELYLLDGTMLAPAAAPPGRSGTFFQRRIEGAFELIERKGTGPTDFTWEVTDKRGTRYLYGETAAARLASYRTGDVFRWHLERAIDAFGNEMRFRYFGDAGQGGANAGAEPWAQLYPAGIDYTAHRNGTTEDLPAHYHVEFILDDGARRDAISNARGGFDVRTRFRLAQIDVKLDDLVIRSYHLAYTEGAFGKSLLQSVGMFGLGGSNQLHAHSFEYFPTDAQNGFGAPITWGQLPSGSTLAQSESDSGGFNVFVGVGDTSCQNHVGVGGGFTFGSDRSKRVIIDVDGDGLPDLIDEDGTVRLNRFAAGTRGLGSFATDFLTGGPGPLAHSDLIGVSLTEAAHVLGELGGLGLDQAWSWTTEDRAFLDVNGDGYPDVVDAAGGVSASLNLLGQNQRAFGGFGAIGGFAPSGDFGDTRANQQLAGKFYRTSPLVKWLAPFTGQVKLAGTVQRLGTGGPDGVKATIYRTRTVTPNNAVDTVVWEHSLAPGSDPCVPAPSNACDDGLAVDVVAGDRLYFKLDALQEIEGDTTSWNPTLSYTSVCSGSDPCAPPDHSQRDVYGLPLYDTARTSDFRIADPQAAGFVASFTGTVQVVGTIRRTAAADAVTLRIFRGATLVQQFPLGPSDPLEQAVSRSIDVNAQDVMVFDLRTGTGIDPGRVSFDPIVSYTNLCRDEGAGPICRNVVNCDDTTRRCTLSDATDPITISLDIVSTIGEVADSAIPVAANEPMAGGFRSWYVAEWNTEVAFSEAGFNQSKSLGQATNFNRMLPRRLGIHRQRPIPIDLPGPVWMGGGADSFIAATTMKPSRIGGLKPEQVGNAPGLRKSKGFNSGESVSLIGSVGHASGDATGLLDFIDLNGDRLPDSLSYDRAQFQIAEGFAPAQPLNMTFGNLRSIANENIRFGFAVGSAASAVANKLEASGTTKAILSILPSLGLHYGNSVTTVDFVDVNGDGLPDHVSKNEGTLTVQLNLGYGFGAPSQLGAADPLWGERVTSSTNDTIALEAAVSTVSGDVVRAQDNATNSLQIGYAGIGGGVAYSVSRTLTDYVDVNGDGLPDQVLKQPADNAMKVKINLGTGFAAPVTWAQSPWPVALERDLTRLINGGNDALAFTENISFNAGIGAPIPIPLLFVCIMIELSVLVEMGQGSSRLVFEDIDGDGKLDHVLKLSGDGNLYAKLNQTGRANLLKSVIRPLGGRVDVDYKRQGNRVDLSDPAAKVDMPRNQWVLASATVSDGQGQTYTKTFEYFDSGFHDRAEREDYGYAHVRSTLEDGATVDDFFHNQDYYRKGLLERRIERDAAGRLFRVSETVYDAPPDLPPITSSFFPGEREHRTFFYEGTTDDLSQPGKSTRATRAYDDRGNLVSFIDEADDGTADDVRYTIDYQSDFARYIFKPTAITARDASGNVLRQRTATYFSTGAVREMTNLLAGGIDPATGGPYTGAAATNPTWHLDYDAFGNLRQAVDPRGFTFNYLYDATVASHRIQTTDSFGLTSSAVPDLRFGTQAQITDVNGNRERFTFDEFGRPSQVFGPDDVDGTDPTIEYTYSLPDPTTPAWVRTAHRDVQHPGDPIASVAFVDGMERLIEIKKDLERDTGTGTATEVGMSVSGRVRFDPRGRVAAQGQAIFVPGSSNTTFVDVPALRETTYDHDLLGRVLRLTTPDSAATVSAYGFATLDGTPRLSRRVTDPTGKVHVEYRTVHEEMVAVEQTNTIAGTPRTLVTRYEFDPMDQLVRVVDANENVTRASYDTIGQMISLESPDAGRTTYRYDLSGNIAARETANLRARNALIRYEYEFNRLLAVRYPDSAPVVYTYGAPGAAFNRAGRVVTRTDESGVEERFYDKLGDVVKRSNHFTTHTGNPGVEATTEYSYDSFGRMLSLIYPDGEVLTYSYDRTGLLQGAAGTKAGFNYVYLAFQGYNHFEQPVRMRYGNGVETRKNYDSLVQRLSDIDTDGAANRQLQRMHYSYDLVGNVTAIHDGVPIPPPNSKGGPTDRTFGYDDLHQLTSARGRYDFTPNKHRDYTFALTYDGIANITRKTQTDVIVQPSGSSIPQQPTSYDFQYAYAGPRPHAATHIGRLSYQFDADGNQTRWDDDVSGQRRTIVWNEEDRVSSLADDGATTRFFYDGDGTRTHKQRMQGETVYVNQFYVAREGQVATKHIFAGDVRIASQIAKSSGGGTPLEEFRYFYHPDHLGSSAMVTDDIGKIFQHNEFFPSGETWVEELSNTERTPYLFNGKELDETGLYYYGARYYDPRASQWESPDPILHEYMQESAHKGIFLPQNLALYSYAWNNPVRLTDALGEKIMLATSLTPAQRKLVLQTVQKLTNDSLFIKGNEIRIAKVGKGGQPHGTDLVRRMIKTARTATVEIEAPGVGNSAPYATPADAINGVGTDSTIKFDPKSTAKPLTKDPKTGRASPKSRPNYIGLGHELIHAERAARGKAIDLTTTDTHTYKDAGGHNVVNTQPNEEFATVGVKHNKKTDVTENQLRKEHGLRSRATY